VSSFRLAHFTRQPSPPHTLSINEHSNPAVTDPEPTILLDTDRTGVLDLMRLLKMYRLRQRVDIDDVSAAYHVWTRWSPQQHAGGAQTIIGAGSDDEQSNVWRPDPRLTQLGLRALLPSADTHNDSSVTDTAAAVPNSAQTVPWTAYKRFRWQLGVAEGDSEIPSGAAIPFQFNIDGLAGISFSKGCYVGQELMARTHFNGVVRKRLMPFSLTSSSADGVTVVPGADLYAESAAGPKPLGKVQLIEGDAGLGVMRLAPTLAALAAGQPLYVSAGGEETKVKVWRPEWWPPAWGTEE
jgi:transferase CAF17, mitochondrial